MPTVYGALVRIRRELNCRSAFGVSDEVALAPSPGNGTIAAG